MSASFHHRGEQWATLLLLIVIVVLKITSFTLWKEEDSLLNTSVHQEVLQEKVLSFRQEEMNDLSEDGEKREALEQQHTKKDEAKYKEKPKTASRPSVSVPGKSGTFREKPEALPEKSKPGHYAICDLNAADTAELVCFPGIGKYTAGRILRYRTQLGGFYSLAQLDEISGLYAENLTILKSYSQIDTTKIIRIPLNTASLEELNAHPYIGFYQASAILRWRQKNGKITSCEDLRFLEEFTERDMERIRYYICF